MRIENLDFNLPDNLIAQEPTRPRDSAKLMVLSRKSGNVGHTNFRKIGEYLLPGDLLVFNDTKVYPARIWAKKDSGGRIELVFLRGENKRVWDVLVGGRLKCGQKVFIDNDFWGEIIKKDGKTALLRVNKDELGVYKKLQEIGHTPLPPYIKRTDHPKDRENYQTVFAKKIGSVAAPTAGLHFTKNLITSLEASGIETAFIELRVGLGTFAPVKTRRVEDHPIHEEYYYISKATAAKIIAAKKKGRRVIAVGTTVVRALESSAGNNGITPGRNSTDLFILPGYKFRVIDGLITNFHTPRSSLLALVYAFAGEKNIKESYRIAVEKKYRFFSYGDGMLIL